MALHDRLLRATKEYLVAEQAQMLARQQQAVLCRSCGKAPKIFHHVDDYDYASQTLTDLPYNVWREYDPEDTMRFYALRLRELGMIKSNPQKIIAENTNWSFLNELKRELKG